MYIPCSKELHSDLSARYGIGTRDRPVTNPAHYHLRYHAIPDRPCNILNGNPLCYNDAMVLSRVVMFFLYNVNISPHFHFANKKQNEAHFRLLVKPMLTRFGIADILSIELSNAIGVG